MKKTLLLVTLLLTLALLTGCICSVRPLQGAEKFGLIELKNGLKLPRRQIAINEMPPTNPHNLSGSFRPNTSANCYIHPSVFIKVKLVQRDKKGDFFDLKVYLNKSGCMLWKKLNSQYKKEAVAFMVDSLLYRSFIPKTVQYDKQGAAYVYIDGPFDKFIARELVKWTPNNYAFYHQEDSK